MSNLGPWQVLVERARDAGGPDALLAVVKNQAVRDKAPALVAAGLAAGVTLGVVGQRALDARQASQAKAAEAEKRLVDGISERTAADPADHGADGGATTQGPSTRCKPGG